MPYTTDNTTTDFFVRTSQTKRLVVSDAPAAGGRLVTYRTATIYSLEWGMDGAGQAGLQTRCHATFCSRSRAEPRVL